YTTLFRSPRAVLRPGGLGVDPPEHRAPGALLRQLEADPVERRLDREVVGQRLPLRGRQPLPAIDRSVAVDVEREERLDVVVDVRDQLEVDARAVAAVDRRELRDRGVLTDELDA